MKKTALASLVLLMLSVSMFQFRLADADPYAFPPGPDLPRILIRNDGTIDPATVPIQHVSNVYTFTDNIVNYTIDVECNNIVIDGAGYTFESNTLRVHGINCTNVSGVTIKNLEIKGFNIAIHLDGSSNIYIHSNKLTDNDNGIGVLSSSNNKIEQNKIVSYNNQGGNIVVTDSSNNNAIVYNELVGNLRGISIGFIVNRMEPSYNNTIAQNNISNSRTGMEIGSSYNAQIENNTITRCNKGVDIGSYWCKYNVLVGNKISDCTECGIQVIGESNTIIKNTIENNKIGIYMGTPHNYTFYHNNFVDNGQSATFFEHILTKNIATEINSWDNGVEGNYWSNYNGTDNNDDGIGDSPYIIDANNTDNFPMMKPVTSPNILPTPALSPSPEPAPEPSAPPEPQQPETEPFPTTLVIAILIIAVPLVGAGLLVYRVKFKKQQKNQSPS